MIKFKNLLLLLAVLFAVVSCSKKVKVEGTIKNPNPLNRIEIIEASGVATLPLVNMGIDKNGKFSGEFEAPKDGMYLLSYGEGQNFIYLKAGQELKISGNGTTFPSEFVVEGDAKANNDFLKQTQKFFISYSEKINLEQLLGKNEAAFISEIKKIGEDLNKNIDEVAKNTGADQQAVDYKKAELNTSLLTVITQYEMFHGQLANDSAYKASAKVKELAKSLDKDPEAYAKILPIYRNYLLQKLNTEFQAFGQKLPVKEQENTSLAFKKFLDTKKDISPLVKDYLMAFIITQSNLGRMATEEMQAEAKKMIETSIHDEGIKKDLEKIYFVLNGVPVGEKAPEMDLKGSNDEKVELPSNGKPTLVMFYASWQPMVAQMTAPMMKEVSSYFDGKMNYLYVNMDDTLAQFKSTSANLMKGIKGTNVWANGGINSKTAEHYGIYGFRLPSFVIIDKEGKIASKTVDNLGDPKIISVMEKLTGKKAPTAPPPPIMNPMQPAPQPSPAPAQPNK